MESSYVLEEAVNGVKKKALTEVKDENQPKKEAFVIKKSDVQFGSVRSSQEDTIRKLSKVRRMRRTAS